MSMTNLSGVDRLSGPDIELCDQSILKFYQVYFTGHLPHIDNAMS